MVTLSSEASCGHAAPSGTTLPGTRVRETEAAVSRPPGGAGTGTSGVIPEPGEGWAGSPPRVAAPGAAARQDANLGGRRGFGNGGVGGWTWNLSPQTSHAALGRGRRSAVLKSPPGPPGAPPSQSGTFRRGQAQLNWAPTGTPRDSARPRSPPPRPTPPPSDSPREYRDLGDSRSRSALSNEMKSEGIAARPSPARGQREGGSGGGGGTSSPGPRAPNRGRRGEGGCLLLLLLLEGSHFPAGRATRTAAAWKAALRSGELSPGESREKTVREGKGRGRAKGSVSGFSSAHTDGRRHRRRR